MKFAALVAGACLALAVSGPTVLNTSGTPKLNQLSDITAPDWIPLPSKPFISSIEYAGEAGSEAAFGTILYQLPSDGASEVTWLKEHLKSYGYAIDDRTLAIDNFAGADVVISARDFSSGRRVNIVATRTVDGATIRVSFEDPLAGTYVSLL
jgi:hypothetical protein